MGGMAVQAKHTRKQLMSANSQSEAELPCENYDAVMHYFSKRDR